MSSIDKYFGAKYHPRKYNCAHFVADVWKDLTGIDASIPLGSFLTSKSERDAWKFGRRQFQPIKEPQDPCIALFKAPRIQAHIGIYIRGKILHLFHRGVEYQPIEVVGFDYPIRRFYLCH